MLHAIMGKKVGMTQIFDEQGNRIPVTVVEAGPCTILQKITPEKNGYSALKIGYLPINAAKLNRPLKGFFEKLKLQPMKHLFELRVPQAEVENAKEGDSYNISIFQEGELVDAIGTSKGRGFQGVVKRWHFKGFPQTRGTHEYRRHPGSIGMREHPGKIFKGKKMPGHMGAVRITTQNLKLVKMIPEKNLLLIQGSVPGPIGGLVMVRKAIKQAAQKAAKA